MKSLFAKILVWFLVTVTLATVALLVTSAITFTRPRDWNMPFGMLTMMQMRNLREAYETGGLEALTVAQEQLRNETGIRAVLTDSAGRDLVTGEDHSALVERARSRPMFPMLRGDRMVVERRSRDGAYWFFLFLPRQRWTSWFLQFPYLAIFGVAILLCYLFARHLSKPVWQLRKAVEQFGQGNLESRVRSKRSDELGDLARTFDTMADRIQTLLAAEWRLLLDISHELRSPLARLSVAAELARSDESRDRALAQIEKESERMNVLLAELLRVTRAEGDPASMQTEEVALTELLEELVGDVAIEAQTKGCAVKLDAADI